MAPYRDDDPQSGGSVGKVYDLDAPGPYELAQDGNIYRYRGNFYAYATLPDGTRISPYYKLCSHFLQAHRFRLSVR